MLHNTLQLQHPIFLLYLALFPVFSISRLSPYCFDLFRGLLGSFSSTSLIFCYYNCIVPNNYVALMFYNNIVSQASYMHLKLLPTCDVYFLDMATGRSGRRREGIGSDRARWEAEGRHMQRQGEMGGGGKAYAATGQGGRRREA